MVIEVNTNLKVTRRDSKAIMVYLKNALNNVITLFNNLLDDVRNKDGWAFLEHNDGSLAKMTSYTCNWASTLLILHFLMELLYYKLNDPDHMAFLQHKMNMEMLTI